MAGVDDGDIAKLLSRLRFRHLQLLVELGSSGSLRAVANRFGVTQPALSRTLGEAEAAFGHPLFTRSARGVEPTAAGRLAIRGAVLLLEEVRHLHAAIDDAERGDTLIRFGATPFLAQGYLPPVIASLAEREGAIRVQLVEANIPALMLALHEGRLDAVLCSQVGAARASGALRLRFESLFSAGFTVVASRQHPLARRRKVNWETLRRQRWILPPSNSLLHGIIEEQFAREGLAMPVAAVEAGVPVTAVRLAAAGAGLAVVPEMTLTYLRAGGGVARIDAAPALRSDEVGLVTRPGPENPDIALLREALR